MTLLEEPLEVVAVPDDLSVLPAPRDADDDSKAWTRRAHPDSPVGRTVARLAAAPHKGPLATLEERIGRKLLDLTLVTDLELSELCGLVLAEKVRRDARWLS